MLALLAAVALEQDPRPPSLAFEFWLRTEPSLSIEVAVSTLGSPDGETIYEVSDAWGGVHAGGADLLPVFVGGAQGRKLEYERPQGHRIVVRHEPGEALIFRYRIPANEHQGESGPATFRRPIVNEHLFHTVGTLALFVPEHLDGDVERTLRFRWRNFHEQGWQVATSFGVAPEDGFIRVRETLDRARHALYVAGDDLRVHEIDVRGSPLVIALAGDRWEFEDAEFTDLASSIVAQERAFFDDFDRGYYLIGLIPVGPVLREGGSSLGGTGLTNCFSLTLHPNAGLAPLPTPRGPGVMGVAQLLAHEMFHEWNGLTVRRLDPEQLVYWFSEGFTNFYARRILFRGGWIDAAEYAASVNEAIEAYLGSPVRNEPNARILEDFWNDRSVKMLPYHRGDVVAMLLDRAIREASGGERSLDDLMRELVREALATGERIDTGHLLERFAHHTDAETAALVRGIVVDGETAPIRADLFAPCLERVEVECAPFELGFDFERSMEANEVLGVVADSAAWRAGLRDGQRLIGWSVRRGDTARDVVLTTVLDGAEVDLRYRPVGDPRRVPRFLVRDGGDCRGL